jgi:hypothetical protein
MTSTAEPTTTPTAAQALTAATEAASAAAAAEVAAGDDVTAAEQAVIDLEASLVGGSLVTRQQLDQARAKIEQARSDVEWRKLQHHAALAAHSRASDAAAAAHRAVVREEYLAAHAAHNDPSSRENVLLAQLTDTVTELVQLIDDRQEQHDRLAHEFTSFPADEKFRPPAGRPITTHGTRGYGVWTLPIPNQEVSDAIDTGLKAAKAAQTERERKRRHG